MELAVFAGLVIVKKFREDEAPVLVSPNLISVGRLEVGTELWGPLKVATE